MMPNIFQLVYVHPLYSLNGLFILQTHLNNAHNFS